MIARAAAVWLLLLVVAVGAGALRAALLEPKLGELRAHQAGSVLVAVLFAATIYLITPWIDPELDRRRLLGVGVAWLVATVAFEFLFGRFVAGHSWRRLVADYDLLAGRLWPLVLAVVTAMPLLTGYLRSGRGPGT